MIHNHDNSKNIQTNISYINIDSTQRKCEPTYYYDEHLYNLPPYALYFKNGSTKVAINLPDHLFNIGDSIVLTNILSKYVVLHNAISIKKNSHFVRIHHPNHGLSFYGLYDPTNTNDFIKITDIDKLPDIFNENDDIPDGQSYYIYKNNSNMDFYLTLSNAKILHKNKKKNFIGNISINYLNQQHRVYLIFKKNNSCFEPEIDSYLIRLEYPANINYTDINNQIDNDNNIYIKFEMLYGVPLHYLNFNPPTNPKILTVIDRKDSFFIVDVGVPAIIDPIRSYYHWTDVNNLDLIASNQGGGCQSYVRRIKNISPYYPEPNIYVYPLDRVYQNIVKIRMISSIFPNPFHCNQWKLYWKNLSDGDYIYHLNITPGNYSLIELKNRIELAFRSTLRQSSFNKFHPQEKINISDQYDHTGHNKYHIVDVNIEPSTNTVTLATFKELIICDTPEYKVVNIPDVFVEFTFNKIILDQEDDLFLVYITEDSLGASNSLNSDKYTYILHNFYRKVRQVNQNTILTKLEVETSFLVNINQHINSINTSTILKNFTYDLETGRVVFNSAHKLKKSDIIITDKFDKGSTFIYQIINIKSENILMTKKFDQNKIYTIIYGQYIIDNNHYGIFRQELTGTNSVPFLLNINPIKNHNNFLIMHHPQHQLHEDDNVALSNSYSVNNVPENIINSHHKINKILDEDHYQIILGKYALVDIETKYDNNNLNIVSKKNMVSVKYPDYFQLLFNYNDTLGKYLHFQNVGMPYAITAFQHKISNRDPYINDMRQQKQEVVQYRCGYDHVFQKLNSPANPGWTIFEPNYFYVCCPLLSLINNTKSVPNVFTIIKKNSAEYIYDSHLENISKIFYNPISTISEFQFSFHYPDGTLVDFNGRDHSFVLEITEIYDQLSNIENGNN